MSNIINWVTTNWVSLVPWVGFLLSELMALVPSWKSSGIIAFILRAIGYVPGTVPTLPTPPVA